MARRSRRSGSDRSVVELRARAGALFAAAAIATSFFGSQTLTRHDAGVAGWVAIGCFVLLGFAVVVMLVAAPSSTVSNTLVTVFRFGVLLLVVEVLAWVLALVAVR